MTELINQLVIDSAYGPQVVIDKPLASGASASPSWLMSVLKPQITVITPLGSKVIAPWGVPGPSSWPVIKIALVAVAAVAVGALLAALLKRL